MYLKHFGMAQYPFSLTPNTRFFLKLPSHQYAFDSLVKALSEEGNFSVITGEVGTGKTMLCRKTLNALESHPRRFTTAFIPHPVLDDQATLQQLADELHIPYETGSSYRSLLKMVTEFILQNANATRQVVLFIDEAQAIPEESLRAVHLLTQIRHEQRSPFKVVLFGQPELEEILERPLLSQVNESIGFRFRLPVLDREGLEAYVQYRLMKAGFSGEQLFNNDALAYLHENSQGIPRMINILCHKSLMVAFGKGVRLIEESHVKAAVEDTLPARSAPTWITRLLGGTGD